MIGMYHAIAILPKYNLIKLLKLILFLKEI